MIRVLLPIIAGIVLAGFLPSGCMLPLLGLAVLCCIAFSVYSKRNYVSVVLLGVCFVLIGTVRTLCFYHSHLYAWSDEQKLYSVVVRDIQKSSEKYVRLNADCFMALDTAGNVENIPDISCKIVFLKDKKAASHDLCEGDTVTFYSQMFSPCTTGNRYEWNEELYLKSRGIGGTSVVYGNHIADYRAAANHSFLKKTRDAIENVILSLSLDKEKEAIVSALVLGNRSGLSYDMRQKYSRVGISHILALSGLHLGIIYCILSYLLFGVFRKGRARTVASLFIIAFLWGYVMVVGMPYSLVRAAILTTLCMVAAWLRRDAWSVGNLVFAATAILLVSPGALYDVGFQLSFMACLAIMKFQPLFGNRFQGNKVLKYIFGIITVSFSAQIGVAPLSILYFHNFPSYFFISNLFAVPLVFVIVGSLFVLLPLCAIVPGVTQIASWCISSEVAVLNTCADFVGGLWGSSAGPFYPTIVQVVLMYLVLIAVYKMLCKSNVRVLQVGMIFVLLLVVSQIYCLVSDRKQMYVCDNFGSPEIGLVSYGKTVSQISHDDWEETDGLLTVGGKKILMLDSDKWSYRVAANRLKVDYIVVCKGYKGHLKDVAGLFEVHNWVLHSSLTDFWRRRYIAELSEMKIVPFDMKKSGMLDVK
ncbi:MAG: ComEC/Rec2 family competence protein [Bacteroidaceae bacterium]|nr:ComEC/Rec2 family competence protein [Bacteroidaceae bacterium]